MLTYDGEDHKQNKAHKEAVSCNWASSAPPRHSFALRLVHRNCSTPSALEHWWKFGKNHPQATTPTCGFPSHALLHVRLYPHHIHTLKFPGYIADQICIVVATHDGHPVLAPGYHSLIWFTCPNIHVTGQKGEWLDSNHQYWTQSSQCHPWLTKRQSSTPNPNWNYTTLFFTLQVSRSQGKPHTVAQTIPPTLR